MNVSQLTMVVSALNGAGVDANGIASIIQTLLAEPIAATTLRTFSPPDIKPVRKARGRAKAVAGDHTRSPLPSFAAGYKPAAKAKVARAPKAKAAKAGKTGTKRDPEKLAALTNALHACIKGHPGERIETIAKTMGTTTKDLALPIRKLKGEDFVFSKGNKRSTVYYATGAKVKATNGVAAAAE
jgi:hypothetical protein